MRGLRGWAMVVGRVIGKNDWGYRKCRILGGEGGLLIQSYFAGARSLCGQRWAGVEFYEKEAGGGGFPKSPHFTWFTILPQLQFPRTLLATVFTSTAR